MEVIEIIDRISTRLANKFRFGYHEVEDMKQQVFVEVLKPDKNGITILEKFDSEKGNSLDSFLWIHARNRLHNFKRDNFARPDLPCYQCPLKAYCKGECTKYSNVMDCEYYFKWHTRNETKKNLASNPSTTQIDVEYDQNLEDNVFSKEIYQLVNRNIPISLREDWIRFTNKLKISKTKREQIIELILEILKENGIDQKTW